MRWGAIALLVLALAGCGPSAGKTPAQAAPAAVKASDLDRAFQAAFGAAPPALRVVARDGETETTLRYRPARLVELGDRVALVSEGQTDGCHGCYGSLAVHYLRRAPGGGFRLIGAWPELVDGTSFGAPPDWKLRTDLFPAPAIEASGGGTWQGCTIAKADFVELTPEKPVVRARQVLTAWTTDVTDEAALEGKARPLRPGQSFAMDYEGAGRLTVEYRRTGEVYAPVGAQAALPDC